MALSDAALDRELREVLALYCEALDRYQPDALADLFTPDCRTDFGPASGGTVAGREAFIDRVRTSQARFSHTHHQLGQTRVRRSGDAVTSITYVTAIHRLHDGSRLDLFMQYHDVWRHDGRWRIAERVMWCDVRSDSCDPDSWNWTPRLPPGSAPA